METNFQKNTTQVFAKTIFHYVPKILKYIDEIKDSRKTYDYSMRYLIMSEMLMLLSEGKSQRFTETAYEDTKYLENISKIIKEKVERVPDAEIYTDVFSRIENQGFKEQKVTSGIDLEYVYSKNINAIKVIYTIIQITHLRIQIIEHSDICGDFNKKYGSVKVFRRKFYVHLTETDINIELIQTKIQIRFDKGL